MPPASTTFMTFLLIVMFVLSHPLNVAVADEVSAGEKLFALKLKPLFAEKCLACHGDDPADIAGGFDMRSRESMLTGGESFSGDVVKLKHGTDSLLYRAVARTEEGYEMPPKAAEALTEEQTWWVRDWINAGAPWPNDDRVAQIVAEYAEGEIVPTSGGLADSWTNRRYKTKDLWAYRPISRPKVPADVHPVDWFIDRHLKEAHLSPAPSATVRDLLRRISFDLTGLPPDGGATPEFQSEYQENPRKAVTAFVDSLMRSPHYGERYAGHWLDVVRYADSAGFANDFSRPNAWRYRDFVVRSFNDDKPFDHFIRQQIAGDEMDESDVENLIATGFLRMGPWEHTAMSVFRETRQHWLDDIVDSVGQTFLAHPLQCAKCHDHKFDPIPTRDYYSMMAVFSTTQFTERDAALLDTENQNHFAASTQWTQAKIAAYNRQKKELNTAVAKARKKEQGDAKTGDNGLSPGDEASLARIGKNVQRHHWELDRVRPIAFSVYTGATVSGNKFMSRLNLPKQRWKTVNIPPDTILTGGDVGSAGAVVAPGAISAAESLGHFQTEEFPAGKGQRRLALANWIAQHNNPLTARTIVNRVWSWHFGRGIAANPNNFGATGGHPTHPELLDYLATWFVDHDWSIKQLNRLIMTSAAYQRSSQHPDPAALAENDPTGTSYASFMPRRLTAEELRDAMLACSGELNREVGGIPCRPDMNIEVAMQPRQIMGGTASVYEPDPQPQQRNRRTLYAEKIRGLRDPFLETFNQPGMDKSCELRETSTVAPQALTLLNATEVHDRALAFANRLIQAYQSDAAAIDALFRTALSRPPTSAERTACLDRWHAATAEEAQKSPAPSSFPSKVTRTVMAEKTGEPYDFVEFMPAYQSYVPDLQPHEVDARTRGLSHVCLVLLNTNEFAYLD